MNTSRPNGTPRPGGRATVRTWPHMREPDGLPGESYNAAGYVAAVKGGEALVIWTCFDMRAAWFDCRRGVLRRQLCTDGRFAEPRPGRRAVVVTWERVDTE